MSKRARYDGPHEEVAVFDSEAGVDSGPIDKVKRGGLLSTNVPARIRDELLQREDWTAVKPARARRPKAKAAKAAAPEPSGDPPAATTSEKGDD